VRPGLRRRRSLRLAGGVFLLVMAWVRLIVRNRFNCNSTMTASPRRGGEQARRRDVPVAGVIPDLPKCGSGEWALERGGRRRATAGGRHRSCPSSAMTTAVQPIEPATTTATSRKCDLKGNISRNGDKIYHEPGDRDYDKTEIDESGGERWFCSTAGALAAGWRAPKN